MLKPVTKRMKDESANGIFGFTFYCDLCGKPWSSVPVAGQSERRHGRGKQACDHAAAYERANLEAIQHFNRCPVCKRWVCDDCFLLLSNGDMCGECAGK